jgi:hypothetical protein
MYAKAFLELVKGIVSKVEVIGRDGAGFYEVVFADGRPLHHVAGKFLTFVTFSDGHRTTEHIEHAKTYPARIGDAYSETQAPYTQLTLW